MAACPASGLCVRHQDRPVSHCARGFHTPAWQNSNRASGCVPRPQLRQRHCQHTAALPFVQAWSTSVDLDAQSLAANIFASSIVPYAAFLYFLQKSGKAPKGTMFGFYFLLVFVGATIPAGIWAKVHYHTSLSNVDWLHGSAESMLTVTNLFIVLGLRRGIRQAEQDNASSSVRDQQDQEQSVTEEVR